MSGFEQFSFGENDSHIGSGRVKQWKAEAGHTYRLSFAWWKVKEDGKLDMGEPGSGLAPQFFGGPANFISGAGYVLNQGPEYTKAAGGESPRNRIVTVVVLWPTDKKGALDEKRLAANDIQVVPWVFGGDKYRNLEQLHKEFPFNEHDITAICTDTTYQKMTFTPCKESLLRRLLGNPKATPLVDPILLTLKELLPGVKDFVGRDLTVAQINEKRMGGANPDPVESVVTGEINDLVDNLLDD